MYADARSPSHPLRILHLTGSSGPGGVTRYLCDLGRMMQRRGHQLVFGGQRSAGHPLVEQARLQWLDLPLNGSASDLLRSGRVLHRWLRDNPVDVIHGHYRKAMLVGRMLGRLHRVPAVFTLHATHVPMSPIIRTLTTFGDQVHVPSSFARQWLTDNARLASSKITIIPHGVDRAVFPYGNREVQAEARHEMELPQDALIAGFVGRFVRQKNPMWLVDLIEAASEQIPHLHLLMIGGGPLETELREAVDRRGLQGQVSLRPYGDPRPAYRAMDALVLPSAYEGFPLTVVEAMSTGRAVLRTDAAGAAEQVLDGQTGRVTEVDRERFIAAALEFLRDREALWRMGEAAAGHVRQSFTLERQAEETERWYRQCINSVS